MWSFSSSFFPFFLTFSFLYLTLGSFFVGFPSVSFFLSLSVSTSFSLHLLLLIHLLLYLRFSLPRRWYLQWLERELGYSKREDWYRCTYKDIATHFGGGLLKLHYDNSPTLLIMESFPDYPWQPWRFSHTPVRYWESLANRKKYLNWVVSELGVGGYEELNVRHFLENFGGGLLKAYGDSPAAVIASLAKSPSSPPLLSSTPRPPSPSSLTSSPPPPPPPLPPVPSPSPPPSSLPRNYWASFENQKRFVLAMATELGILKDADLPKWYQVTVAAFHRRGGYFLRTYYSDSLYHLLSKTYPSFSFHPWEFSHPSSKVLMEEETLKRAVEELEKRCRIIHSEDWYRVPKGQFLEMKVRTVILKHGGLYEVLRKLHPEVTWEESLLPQLD